MYIRKTSGGILVCQEDSELTVTLLCLGLLPSSDSGLVSDPTCAHVELVSYIRKGKYRPATPTVSRSGYPP